MEESEKKEIEQVENEAAVVFATILVALLDSVKEKDQKDSL